MGVYLGLGKFLLLLIFISLSFAVVVDVGPSNMTESSNRGSQWANSTASEKCSEANVQAVYECLGDVVRVVSTIPGQGSTFYKPDGEIVKCPVVSPTAMGAECLSMMTPNYCPMKAQCGNSPAPSVFPGQNNTPEQTGNTTYYIVPGQAANNSNNTQPTPQPPAPAQAAPPTPTPIAQNNLDAPATVKNNVDSPLSYLVIVLFILGVAAVALLFYMFKNSISEDLD